MRHIQEVSSTGGRRKKVPGKCAYINSLVVVDVAAIKIDVAAPDIDTPALPSDEVIKGQFREVSSAGGRRRKVPRKFKSKRVHRPAIVIKEIWRDEIRSSWVSSGNFLPPGGVGRKFKECSKSKHIPQQLGSRRCWCS